jgi:hypothetical protein
MQPGLITGGNGSAEWPNLCAPMLHTYVPARESTAHSQIQLATCLDGTIQNTVVLYPR